MKYEKVPEIESFRKSSKGRHSQVNWDQEAEKKNEKSNFFLEYNQVRIAFAQYVFVNNARLKTTTKKYRKGKITFY